MQEKISQNTHFNELDIMKGIGIWLVVIGHLKPVSYTETLIYSVHKGVVDRDGIDAVIFIDTISNPSAKKGICKVFGMKKHKNCFLSVFRKEWKNDHM